ncbi:MAG: T9SS type A sorting domain-containing protein [Bacteroidales bacterium]
MAVVESIEYPFVAVEIQEQAEKPSLDFETNQLISFDPALSTGVLSASVGLSSSKKLFGNYSNEFKYEFSKDGNSYYKLNEPLWLSEGNCLGFYLLGDLTENEIGFEVKGVAQDKSETAELVSVGNLNFFGWEYKEKEFNMQPSRRYKLTGFYVRQAEGELNAKGNFFMDNLHNYNELLNSVSTIKSADIQVYPNPAHEWIYINIPDGNSGCMLQLYTLDGHLIKSSEGVRINVSEVLNGMYILKIKTKTTLTSQVVQIRHY